MMRMRHNKLSAPDNHRNIHEAFVIGQQCFRLFNVYVSFLLRQTPHKHTTPNTIWKIIRSTNMKIRWILLFTWCTLQTLGMHLTKIVAVSSHNEQYTRFLKIWYEIAVKIYSMDAGFAGVFKMNIANFCFFSPSIGVKINKKQNHCSLKIKMEN